MESNINNKDNKMNMSKLSIMLIMFCVMLGSVFAEEQLFRYDFEEGSGALVLDQSGNDFNSLIAGTSWATTPVKFGTYSMFFDGNNDWIDAINPTNLTLAETISFYIYLTTAGQQVVYTYFDTNVDIEFRINPNLETELDYRGVDLSNDNIQSLEDHSIVNLAQNVWHHFVITIDYETGNFTYYRNNTLLASGVLNPLPYYNSSNVQLRIGASQSNNQEVQGYLDEFHSYDFILNETQVGELFTGTNITFPSNVTEVNDTGTLNIINYTLPITSELLNDVNFQAVLNFEATCDLYIDNQLYKEFEDIVAFNEAVNLPLGSHTYFVYCSFIDGNMLYYEISPTYQFNVNDFPPNLVTFNIAGTDFDVNGEDLVVTSPCLIEGYSAVGTDKLPYRAEYNPNGAYFSPVVNGQAQFNLGAGEHEFCLYNGRIIVSDTDRTNNYDIVTFNGMVDLGTLDIPNNVTTTFNVNLDVFDVYGKTNPKAWGQTWTTIILGLIMVVVGALVTLAGVRAGEGKVALVGGLIFLAGMGVEFTGIVGLIV